MFLYRPSRSRLIHRTKAGAGRVCGGHPEAKARPRGCAVRCVGGPSTLARGLQLPLDL